MGTNVDPTGGPGQPPISGETIREDPLGYPPDSPAKEPAVVRRMQFAPLRQELTDEPIANLQMLLDVGMRVAVELGRTTLSIREVLALTRGSVVELDKLAGEAVDLYANDTVIAHGEVVVVGERFGIRVTEVVAPTRPLGLGPTP